MKNKFIDADAIRKYVDELSTEEIYRILTHASLAQLTEWQKMLEGERDPVAISNMKGCFIQAEVRIPAQILNDDKAVLMFIYLLTERLATRK